MALVSEGSGLGQGIAFLVAAEVTSSIVAKACSSPQTTELNADKRAPTLMKWVNIGLLEAALFIAVAAYVDQRHRGAILAGGILEGAITYGEYLHGKSAGLKNGGPTTEGY